MKTITPFFSTEFFYATVTVDCETLKSAIIEVGHGCSLYFSNGDILEAKKTGAQFSTVSGANICDESEKGKPITLHWVKKDNYPINVPWGVKGYYGDISVEINAEVFIKKAQSAPCFAEIHDGLEYKFYAGCYFNKDGMRAGVCFWIRDKLLLKIRELDSVSRESVDKVVSSMKEELKKCGIKYEEGNVTFIGGN